MKPKLLKRQHFRVLLLLASLDQPAPRRAISMMIEEEEAELGVAASTAAAGTAGQSRTGTTPSASLVGVHSKRSLFWAALSHSAAELP